MRLLQSSVARFDLSRMWVLGAAPYCARTRMHLTHTHTHTLTNTLADIHTLNAAVARVAISGWVIVVISAEA